MTPNRTGGASVDITARKRSEEATRDLTGRLLHAQEEERARIARALHDGLSQNLALLSIELQSFGRRLPESAGQINARLDEFSSQTKGLSIEVHRISHGLHPAKLTQLGLVVALKAFCREVQEAHGLTVHFSAHNVPREFPQDVALCLYRVGQEAIQNVVKHSGATKATVTLVVTDETSTLTISDNGKGFEPAAVRPSLRSAWSACANGCDPWRGNSASNQRQAEAHKSRPGCHCKRGYPNELSPARSPRRRPQHSAGGVSNTSLFHLRRGRRGERRSCAG